MGLRQKRRRPTKRHVGRSPGRQTATATGVQTATLGPTRSRQPGSQNGRRSIPVAMPPIHSDTVRQMAALPHHNYPPRFSRPDVGLGFAQQYPSSRPKLFSPDLRLLRLYVENRLLIESGSAVNRLMDLDDHGTSDIRRPSDRAQVRAHRMLVDLANLEFTTVASDVYSDPDGAIRLLWARDDRTVELVFPSIESEAPYLYHSDARNYGVEENPSADCAWKWLNWVINAVLPGHVNAA